MFPCISGEERSDLSPPDDSQNQIWLKNASFVPLQNDSILSQEEPISSNKQDDTNANESSPMFIEKKQKAEKRKAPKDKKKKKKRHKSDKQQEKASHKVRLSEADIGKVFIEEVSGLLPEHAFRLDRNANLSIFRFHSLAPGHIARYRRARNLLRLSGISFSTEEEKNKKQHRYFYEGKGAKRARLKEKGLCVRMAALSADGDDEFLPLGEVKEEIKSSEDEGAEGNENEERARLNSHLRENPNDVDAWICLAQTEESQILEASLTATHFERIEAILERAVAANPASIPLLIHQLETAEGFWSNESLLRQWRQMVFTYPNRIDAWKAYLQFLNRQSSGSYANVSSISAATAQCCSTVRDILAGRLWSHGVLPGTEEAVMDVFEEHCKFLADCGHKERAVSCWQLALEVNLVPYSPDVSVLEEFWESGVPKVGEFGARGIGDWRTRRDNGDDNKQLKRDIPAEEEALLLAPKARSDHWVAVERLRESAHWLPASPDDEEVEDPERVVLYEDVAKLAVTRWSSPRLRQRLLLCCLRSLGVELDDLSMRFRLKETLDTRIMGPAPLEGVDARKQFVREIIEAAREAFSQDAGWCQQLTEMQLEFEVSYISQLSSQSSRTKELKRIARSLLKSDHCRTHLSLYRRYAEAEWSIGGGTDAARRIFDTTALLPRQSTASSSAFLRLIASYAHLEWPGTRTARVLGLLVTTEEPSPADTLRCARHLSQLHSELSQELSKIKEDEADMEMETRAAFSNTTFLLLLHRLLNSDELGEPVAFFRQALASLAQGKMMVDARDPFVSLTAAGIDVLLKFAYPRFLSPEPIRKLLDELPTCAAFLKLQFQMRSRSGLLGLGRRVGEKLGSSSSPEEWLTVIGEEEERERRRRLLIGEGAREEGGVINRIRSLYQMAVRSRRGRGCWQLWRRYLLFETTRKERARGVFYQAIQQCPYAKPLLITGVEVLPEVLQEAVDVLVERGCRLRVPLEELDLLLKSINKDDVPPDGLHSSP